VVRAIVAAEAPGGDQQQQLEAAGAAGGGADDEGPMRTGASEQDETMAQAASALAQKRGVERLI
jgi:hypothetical protein